MRVPRRRGWIVAGIVALLLIGAVAVLFPKWAAASRNGGQKYAEPFQIAGNFYYVGANDIASFLVTGPEGHVLIDGGYPGTSKLILASIRELGFDIRDVEVLLNSEPHYDHAGGLAELQDSSGARLWASDASATAMSAGGYDRELPFPMRLVSWAVTRVLPYRAPRVDRRLNDGDTIRVGTTAITAHVTGGHTRGCTTFSFAVRDSGRELEVVSACSLVVIQGTGYPGQHADFGRTFRVLRSLPADIWVTSHARLFGRYRKFTARATARNPADPFIDPEGYRAYIDSGEARFRRGAVQ